MKKSSVDLSDEQLVEIVCSKDQEEYEVLVKRYQVKLVNYAKYLIGDQEQSQDVVQESFIKAFINLKGFDTSKKFSSWIYRIVHNEVMNFLKKKKAISLEENEWLEQIEDNQEDLEEIFEKKELKKWVSGCLEQLHLSYRECLVLYFIEGYSYQEIAQILKVPIGTVGTNVRRGKKMLKEIFLQNGKIYVKR